MRVSDSTRLDIIQRSVTTAQERYTDVVREATSGARINAPSDDPVGAARVARIQGDIDRTATYRSTIKVVRGDLDLSESALAGAEDLMLRAHDLAMQGADGSLTDEARSALAEQVTQLREQLTSLANTQGSNGYIFGGTNTSTPPFADDGTFAGDENERELEVSAGVTMKVNITGAKAFTESGGRDVFADLVALESALTSGDTDGIQNSVNALDSSHSQILAARTDAGALLRRLDTADAAHDQTDTALQTARHATLDSNPAETYSRLAAMQQSLDASLNVARQTLSTLSASHFS